jgi:predicted transcriptional regulator
MQRTQIFLTESEQDGLQRLAKSRGSTVSAVIRDAVDQYLHQAQTSDWQARRLAAFGLWANRPAPELEALRAEERFGDWNDR